MELEFSGPLWFWRGPAPFHFLTLPQEQSDQVASVAAEVTYGWGMIPVTARVGQTGWTTSLWPKDGGYVLPVKKAVQSAEHLALGDVVCVRVGVRT